MYFTHKMCSSGSSLACFSSASTLRFSHLVQLRQREFKLRVHFSATHLLVNGANTTAGPSGEILARIPQELAQKGWPHVTESSWSANCYLLLAAGSSSWSPNRTDPSNPSRCPSLQSQLSAVTPVVHSTAGASRGYCKTSAKG